MLKHIISCGGFSDSNSDSLVVVLYHTVVLLWSGHKSLSVGRGSIYSPLIILLIKSMEECKNKATFIIRWPCGEDSGSVLKYDKKAAILSSLSIHVTLRANSTGYRKSKVALCGQNEFALKGNVVWLTREWGDGGMVAFIWWMNLNMLPDSLGLVCSLAFQTADDLFFTHNIHFAVSVKTIVVYLHVFLVLVFTTDGC